jgi:2-methylcitrate dehydratase PrpD
MGRETITEQLAGFVTELDPTQLPPGVAIDATRRFVDTVGVAVGGTRLDSAAALLGAAKAIFGDGTAGVVGTALRLPAAAAAFVNGSLAHGADFDDTHPASIVHPSAVVVPAALALGEQLGAAGADCAVAAIAGAEVGLRIALPAGRGFMSRGYHPTLVCGPFAAAATAARLLRLDQERTANALGLASSQSAGLLQSVYEGTLGKTLHPGWAAQAGITCALLAERGFTGPKRALEGEAGLYRVLLGEGEGQIDPSPAVADLGDLWHYPETVFKPYPSAAWTHASLDAFGQILDAERLSAGEIETVICRLPAAGVAIVGDRDRAWRPSSPYHMKNSLPFVLAIRAVRGHLLVSDFEPTALADRQTRQTAEAVTVTATDDLPAEGFPARVSVKTHDGRGFEVEVPVQRGSAANPMTAQEHHAKFRTNVAPALGEERAEAALSALEDIWAAPPGELPRVVAG